MFPREYYPFSFFKYHSSLLVWHLVGPRMSLFPYIDCRDEMTGFGRKETVERDDSGTVCWVEFSAVTAS